MEIDPATLATNQIYAIMIRSITPRPIAWVSTTSPRGIPNLAPFSYFAGVASNPPTLMVSVGNKPDGTPKDTYRNIESNPQFVVNIVPFRLGEAMFTTSHEFDYEINEFEQASLKSIPSRVVAPPRVAESPIHLECKLVETVQIGQGAGGSHAVFGEIIWIHVDSRILDDRGKIDPEKVDTIGRMGGRMYTRTRERFELK